MTSGPAPEDTSADRRVTVVVPTLNRWRFLRTTLWGVMGQQGTSPAIIVVDEGSSDSTPQLLETLNGEVEVLRHTRPWGVSAARNHALRHVSTEWVAFLDDDDVWAPSHLFGLLAAADEASANGRRADLVYVGRLVTDSARRVIGVRHPPPPEELAERLRTRNSLGPPSAVLMRTSSVREAGGFDEQLSLHADWELWRRLVRTPFVERSPQQSLGYMVHGANMHLLGDLALRELDLLADAGLTPKARYVAECHRRAGHSLNAAAWYYRSWRRDGDLPGFRSAAAWMTGIPALKPTREVPWTDTVPWLEDANRVDRLASDATPW